MGLLIHVQLLLLSLIPPVVSQFTEFISVDCGGIINYTDLNTGLVWISDTGITRHGKSVLAESPSLHGLPYQNRRDFPLDGKKYCYKLSTKERRRYLVRATFCYGSSGNGEDTYPSFELYLDATLWGTVTVVDASRVYVKEMIIIAPSDSIDVCLCCATTGFPFISTVELRPLNLSMYATDFENDFWLDVAARVNFGSSTENSVRYPDDQYDRIWSSDLEKRPNYLVGKAHGTKRIHTERHINTRTREYPPERVMQSAVVGTEGSLAYRLDLVGFPANARAYAYFAEIEELGVNENRKFRMVQPYMPDYSNAVVNIAENANGSYTLYEPSYMNVTLDFVFSFAFEKTVDSTLGPLLNAIEISKYLPISPRTDVQDVASIYALCSLSTERDLIIEEGDPCIPIQWDWVVCSSEKPPRITKISLSGKKLKGEIPPELNNMDGITELWLDGNFLTGPIPDLSKLMSIKIMHLENNNLSGSLPSYFGAMQSLHELYVQNNSFSGNIPPALLNRKIVFMYGGNKGLIGGGWWQKKHLRFIIGCIVTIIIVITLLIGSICYHRRKATIDKTSIEADSSRLVDEGVSYSITLSHVEEATNKFSQKIGEGSFGPVYYGRMSNGKEVAVKIMADSSNHGTKQFLTEVALLSRIHHRNLVTFIGYCEEQHRSLLVYEFMHNGTLRDHIHGSLNQKHLDWLARLYIAEDAAKGVEYLHSGCNPSIIHRDVKTSNILLDINMRAKVSDFGLSRQADEDRSHVSSIARGTLGYLDPAYYVNQELTEKTDVYSFGVVLLELLSGRKPISLDYGNEWSIVHWARSSILKGDVTGMVDPVLAGNVQNESIWKVAEIAVQCVEQNSVSRPKMSQIILAIQDAIKIERGKNSSGTSKVESPRNTLLTNFLEFENVDAFPTAR